MSPAVCAAPPSPTDDHVEEALDPARVIVGERAAIGTTCGRLDDGLRHRDIQVLPDRRKKLRP